MQTSARSARTWSPVGLPAWPGARRGHEAACPSRADVSDGVYRLFGVGGACD